MLTPESKARQTSSSSLDGTELLSSTQSQAATVKGVVWEIPDDYQEAAQDLLEMQLMGINAVRTGLLYDDGLLSMADSLGITIFRELPFFGYGTQGFADSLAVSDSLITLLLESGRGHPSSGPIGLIRNSDTSSAKMCPLIRSLAQKITAQGGTSYYVTNFIESDKCFDAVDFVLIDALDNREPHLVLDRWIKTHGTKVGLARVGTYVTPQSEPGVLIQGSPEYQARFLEDVFQHVNNSSHAGVFVHRWKDENRQRYQLPDPYRRNYGLYNRAKDPRPSLYVARGVFLGVQDTFVFEKGDPIERPLHWFTLVGWILLSMMSVIYAGSPRFRSIIPRYFFAHGFYRNSVREAREVLPLTSSAILTIMGLSIGLIAAHVITAMRETRLMLQLFAWMDSGARTTLTLVLDAPFILAILMGSIALMSMSLWMAIWIGASGRRTPLYPSQALMLAVWPRWQVLFILPVAMTFESVVQVPIWATALVAITWILCAYWATMRTAFDLSKVARIAPGKAAFIWLLNPLILGTLIVGIWSLFNLDLIAYVWHLAVRP